MNIVIPKNEWKEIIWETKSKWEDITVLETSIILSALQRAENQDTQNVHFVK
jgi:hypothetical protein